MSSSLSDGVSVLFNEPKLLKLLYSTPRGLTRRGFSALQRAEIAEMRLHAALHDRLPRVSVLFNEPKLLKFARTPPRPARIARVSVLFNEPKLLKYDAADAALFHAYLGFSALQRAEIAEMMIRRRRHAMPVCFSALQRAEIAEIAVGQSGAGAAAAVSVLFNEPKLLKWNDASVTASTSASFSALQRAEIAEIVARPRRPRRRRRFSALQRAEIAEIGRRSGRASHRPGVSVLFNEPKLLKCTPMHTPPPGRSCVSVLFNEPKLLKSYQNPCAATVLLPVSVLFNEPKLLTWETRGNVHKRVIVRFSALQRAEIAEIRSTTPHSAKRSRFQCSSTSRNC